MGFPIQRLRRLRQHESLRRMVRETTLSPSDFIYPLFVVEGQG
ncbi:MAG: porphobilinogen synthase, partial [Nitrospirota bacterium]